MHDGPFFSMIGVMQTVKYGWQMVVDRGVDVDVGVVMVGCSSVAGSSGQLDPLQTINSINYFFTITKEDHRQVESK